VSTPDSDAIRRLRRVGEACLWVLVIGVTIVAVLWLASLLRVVVLPVILALVLATFLSPPAQLAKRRGWPDGLAALVVVLVALAALVGVGSLVWSGLDDFDELDVSLSGGVAEIQRWFTEGPLGLSDAQIEEAFERVQEQIQENVGGITAGAITGAVVVIEVIVGLVLALVLLFFFLKDGERMWDWLCSLAPPHMRHHVAELGQRSWTALAGFLRGQTLVAAFDAFFIGLALVILGVPFVVPLVIITFFGAYVPIVGAFVAGLAAVLVALVSEGLITALIVLAAIIAVQQIESNIFEPVIVGRTVRVHPVSILLGVTAGVVLAGIIGAMVAAPIVAVGSAILGYLREQSDESAVAAEP
jgi:putative heme transporter